MKIEFSDNYTPTGMCEIYNLIAKQCNNTSQSHFYLCNNKRKNKKMKG